MQAEWLTKVTSAARLYRRPTDCPFCGYPLDSDPCPFPLWPTPQEVGTIEAGTSFHGSCCKLWMDWWAYGGECGSHWAEVRSLWVQYHPEELPGEESLIQIPLSRFGRLFLASRLRRRLQNDVGLFPKEGDSRRKSLLEIDALRLLGESIAVVA